METVFPKGSTAPYKEAQKLGTKWIESRCYCWCFKSSFVAVTNSHKIGSLNNGSLTRPVKKEEEGEKEEEEEERGEESRCRPHTFQEEKKKENLKMDQQPKCKMQNQKNWKIKQEKM